MKITVIVCLLITICAKSNLYAKPDSLFRIIENGRFGYIDAKGKVVIAPRFRNGSDFSDGLAAVRLDGYYGYIDKKGSYIIPPKYEFATGFENGIAVVYVKGAPRLIDILGNTVLGDKYKELSFITPTKARAVTKKGKMGYIDVVSNKLFVDTIYSYSIPSFYDGVAVIGKSLSKNEYVKGVIDTLGNMIVPFGKYKEIGNFLHGYSLVKIGGNNAISTGVIDTKGNLLFSRPDTNNISFSRNFCNGLSRIEQCKYRITDSNGVSTACPEIYCGYINLKGKIVLNDTSIYSAGDFSCGRAFISKSNYADYMLNTQMKRVEVETFKTVNPFKGGYAIVDFGHGWGIIDTNGTVIVKPCYDKIEDIWTEDSCFIFSIPRVDDGLLYGIANLRGEILLKPIIERFDEKGFVNGLLKATVDGRLTYINRAGEIVWQKRKYAGIRRNGLNIDFMNFEQFYANFFRGLIQEDDSLANKEDYGFTISSKKIKQNRLSVIIDTADMIVFDNKYTGYRIFIANATKDTIKFPTQDHMLYMKLQAVNDDGKWADIEDFPTAMCGYSYRSIQLQPNACWRFVIPKYDGAQHTQVRAVLEYGDRIRNKNSKKIYSNVVYMGVNPGQFWNKQTYYPKGIMDPYNE